MYACVCVWLYMHVYMYGSFCVPIAYVRGCVCRVYAIGLAHVAALSAYELPPSCACILESWLSVWLLHASLMCHATVCWIKVVPSWNPWLAGYVCKVCFIHDEKQEQSSRAHAWWVLVAVRLRWIRAWEYYLGVRVPASVCTCGYFHHCHGIHSYIAACLHYVTNVYTHPNPWYCNSHSSLWRRYMLIVSVHCLQGSIMNVCP